MSDLVQIVKKIGLNTKEAKIYLAALELGEASIQDLAKNSNIKRTTLYYIIDELLESGVLIRVKTGRKTYYIAEQPANLLQNAKDNVADFEDFIDLLEDKANRFRKKPGIYFLYGSVGFKQAWDMILNTKEKEYRIITEGVNFLDYVKEKYIINELIAKKKKLGVSSRQLITNSEYARSIIAKDVRENRVSKILPAIYKLPFTEIITESIVVFISPRFGNMIFVVEDEAFSKTRKSMFEITWESIK